MHDMFLFVTEPSPGPSTNRCCAVTPKTGKGLLGRHCHLTRIKIMGTHGISKHEIITKNFKLYETAVSLCRAKAGTKSLSLLLSSFATERKGAASWGL